MITKYMRAGEIFYFGKDKPNQIISVATHTETGEAMVVFQQLYDDYRTFVKPLDLFINEVGAEDIMDEPLQDQLEEVNAKEGTSVFVSETSAQDHTWKQVASKEQEDVDVQEDTKVREEINVQDNTEEQENSGVQVDTIELKDSNGQEDKNQMDGDINSILLDFLDAASYSKKLEILTTNSKNIDDRIINDMAASLDCTIEEGPLEQRQKELITCLQAMCRFEDRRLR